MCPRTVRVDFKVNLSPGSSGHENRLFRPRARKFLFLPAAVESLGGFGEGAADVWFVGRTGQ